MLSDNEARYQIISSLLQAGSPMALSDLGKASGVSGKRLTTLLSRLVSDGSVVEGDLLLGKKGPHYCWAARWGRQTKRRAAGSKTKLRATVDAAKGDSGERLTLDSEPVLAFHDYILGEYEPPKDKRFLVFFQCSVRRPFSASPSHGTIRRAVAVATGYDPANDFEACPVHVVVLASTIGPVPYELQDVYPANVRSGGVNHYRPEHFAQVKPILAERIAQYITTHGEQYDKIATFTGGRYGEVMAEARERAGVDFPIFPSPGGPTILRMGKSKPRTYWGKYWIQLYLEIVSWLKPAMRKQAEARLKKLNVKWE